MNGPRIGELFSGYGGLGMGVQAVLGGDIAWHSEIDPGACKILAHRYPDVPNLGDITAIDWAQVEPVDVLTGGFPCQDVSHAGKRAGMRPDTRSGLWSQMAYAIDQLRPGLVVAENVRGLLSAHADSDLEPCPWCVGDAGGSPLRALGAVLGDLAELGYDTAWHGLRAADVGAPHGRFRVFVVAWPAADADDAGRGEYGRPVAVRQKQPAAERRGRGVAADADRDGLGGLEELHGVPRTRREGRGDRHDADGLAMAQGGVGRPEVAWGAYAAAIHRWERVLGRVAPSPTERGAKGQPRLSPAFVEWMQGLPAGWVTDVPGITRNEALKALGNGVVPAQAAEALRRLLAGVVAPSQEVAGLLPTPSAGNFNDGESVEQWEARRQRQAARGINGNGMGTPLAIAVQRTQGGAA